MRRRARGLFRFLLCLLVIAQFFPAGNAKAKSGEFSSMPISEIETQAGLFTRAESGPQINVWYGLNQEFGVNGLPQRQINILGNVSGAVSSLSYSLNDGPYLALRMGPDTRRLNRTGDFNVEIFDAELKNGNNQLILRAVDGQNSVTTTTVNINYTRTEFWSLPNTLDWNAAISIPEQVQVVDGNWMLEPQGIRPREVGYDRLIGIGDISWKDYEVKVPITIHGIDETGYNDISTYPTVGILMRWNGHTDDPVSNWQPKSGWFPFGALAWYSYDRNVDGTEAHRLKISGNQFATYVEDRSGKKLSLETPYYFKVRVESVAGKGAMYSFKVWETGSSEPAEWDLTAQANPTDPGFGSLLLLAHHVDASFGRVEVWPLNASQPHPSTIVSDDFNTCSLDVSRWNFIDPSGGSTYTITGGLSQDANLTISVPSGSSHNFTTSSIIAPRMAQVANDTDFAVYAKFDSGLSQDNQMQGVVFEQDASNYLRIDFNSQGNNSRIYAASYLSGTMMVQKDMSLAGLNVAPLFLSVERKGSRWTVWFSDNGIEWTPFASFPAELIISRVGPYAGNTGDNAAPAHTAKIDFFMNAVSPILVEDAARNNITINSNGSGNVDRAPTKENYSCGEQVTLYANPAQSWAFQGWSGDLSTISNPVVITMNGARDIVANFTPFDQHRVYVPLIIR